MSIRVNKLWEPDGRPSLFLMRQWTAKGAAQPLYARVSYLEQDRSAQPHFRKLWEKAFPAREALPFEALAEKDGSGSARFWDVFDG